MAEVFLSAVFALKPTATKRAVLDRALDAYSSTLAEIVGGATGDAALLAEITAPDGQYRGRPRAPSARVIVARLRHRFGLKGGELSGALRDSLLQVAAMQLASYAGISSEDGDVGVPNVMTAESLTAERHAALEEVALAVDAESERAAAARLHRAFQAERRAFCLFQRARELDLQRGQRGRFHVSLPLLARGTARSRVVLGLYGDRWQEEQFLNHPMSTPRNAVLVRRDDRYTLHVSFAIQVPEPAAPRAVLAIFPGRNGRIGASLYSLETGAEERAWTFEESSRVATLRRVADDLRTLQHRGGIAARRRAVLQDLSFVAVRDLLDAAEQESARLALPDLGAGRARMRSKLVRELADAWNFRPVLEAIGYKAALRGLPKPLTLSTGAWAARECPECASGSGRARMPDSVWEEWAREQENGRFRCSACGHEDAAERAAARVLGRAAVTLARGKRVA